MGQDFQKRKLNKPTGGGSGTTFDEIDTLQQEEGSTESLLAEVDYLLDASLKPIELEKQEKQIQQKKSKSSDSCTCF